MFSWYKLRKYYPTGLNPKEYWDRKYEADGLQKDDPEEYRKQLFYPLLIKYLEKGKSYIDAGCGLGGWLAFLRARGYDLKGIDSSPKAIEMARQMNPDSPVQVGEADALPFPDQSFDGYMAIGTWEYLEDGTEKAANEAKRVLKTGGHLFIEVPYANPFRRYTYLPLKTFEYFIKTLLMRKPATFSNHIFRKGDIRVLLENCGFEVLEMNPHDLPEPNSHYGLWLDWPFLRGARPYELNPLGLTIKKIMNNLSPWMIATGMFFVARKK